MDDLSQVMTLVRGHNRFVRDRIDLIASNSWISGTTRVAMSSLLANSYCIGLPGNRLYGGCSYIDMIEREVIGLVRRVFGTRHAVVQFLSGMQANIGAYNALLESGDTIVAAPTRFGGHYSHTADGPLRFFSPRIVECPFDPDLYNIDLDGLREVFSRERPRLLICGWSEFLFAHPLAEIRMLCDEYDVRLMYDMSHVAGLIAGGLFQPDAPELADIVTSSTGKSLHAPDHGMVLYNDDVHMDRIHDAVMPLLTSNTHPQEVAALGLALSEMEVFGHEYAVQVVGNSRALGTKLSAGGMDVLYADQGFTDSHTVLVRVVSPEASVTLLDRAGILCNACELPDDPPGRMSGLRLGTQAVTRRGFTEAEMADIADAICAVMLRGDDPDNVHFTRVRPLAQSHTQAAFSFDVEFPDYAGPLESVYANLRAQGPERQLRELIPFANCAEEEMRYLADHIEVVHAESDQVLFEPGDPSDSVWFIIDGEAQVSIPARLGEEQWKTLGAGTHFGELGVMTQQPRSRTVHIQAGTHALRIEAPSFRDFLDRSDPAREYFTEYNEALDKGPLPTPSATTETANPNPES